jgi:hypothetical protein
MSEWILLLKFMREPKQYRPAPPEPPAIVRQVKPATPPRELSAEDRAALKRALECLKPTGKLTRTTLSDGRVLYEPELIDECQQTR